VWWIKGQKVKVNSRLEIAFPPPPQKTKKVGITDAKTLIHRASKLKRPAAAYSPRFETETTSGGEYKSISSKQ
jgi:hypothetical protein